ncbi:hypothetical protein JAAARDRAFT_50215 [Jaapia argillacea MUCL 33604]|uniref:Uncharacterized protein n=1 Tax=Jaapia argillacea MUCL 33604 TaxID=933084 RepID=A0A067PCQ5_9AGAM|nr:hypothetical protein JAAARDRAFT_50215 [Jaapia argillacea MUCL 33604]
MDDPEACETVACLQTLESLKQYGVYDECIRWIKELVELTWGRKASDGIEAIPPVYELGLKRNDRSQKNFPPDNHDGSYSLAATVGKGQGQGPTMPATQVNTEAANKQIGRINTALSELIHLIFPCCISKLEYDLSQFVAENNNVPSFGKYLSNATGVQLNISSTFDILSTDDIEEGDLAKSIGEVQGTFHPDTSDHAALWTGLLLMFRLPPGSDPGIFCLAQHGLYMRVISQESTIDGEIVVVFILFKGVAVHCGFPPAVLRAIIAELLKTAGLDIIKTNYNRTLPYNRFAFVMYPGHNPNSRSTSQLIAPPLRFGNGGAGEHILPGQLNFAEHGHRVFPCALSRANYLGREAAFAFWNLLQVSQLKLAVPFSDILASILYQDEDGKLKSVEPLKWDTLVTLKRRSVVWGTGFGMSTGATALGFTLPKQTEIGFKDYFAVVQKMYLAFLCLSESGAVVEEDEVLQVEKVVERTYHSSKVKWCVKFQGEDEARMIEEGGWMFQDQNKQQIFDFFVQHSTQSIPLVATTTIDSPPPTPRDADIEMSIPGEPIPSTIAIQLQHSREVESQTSTSAMELVTISTSSLSPDPTTSDTPLTEPHMASPHPEVEPSTLNLIDGVQSSTKTSKIPLFLPSPTPELDNNPEERPHHSKGFIPPPLSPERASSFSMIQVDGPNSGRQKCSRICA